MTSLDASFTLDLILIVFAIFVLGMIGLSLADLPDNTRQNKLASKENQQPSDNDENSSHNDKPAIDDAQSDYTQRQSNHYERRPVSDYQRRMIFLTVGIVGVTGFYTGVSIFQWNAMRTANALTQDQFRLSNRPWIGLVANSPVQIDKEIDYTDGKTIEFVGKFNIQNYGTSVAVNTITLRNGMSPDPEKACHQGFPGMKDRMKETCDAGRKFATGEVPTIPPSHEKLGIVLFPNQTATAMLELAADLGTRRPVNVAITGCAVYVDQREELHETQFCIEAMFDGQRFEPWSSCNVCNEAK
jgi:hypothetical protein